MRFWVRAASAGRHFHRNEAPVRLQRCDENRLGVVAIVLGSLALAEGYHQIRRQQFRAMPERLQRARPEVRRAAGFHRYRARRQIRRPLRETSEAELLEEHRAP